MPPMRKSRCTAERLGTMIDVLGSASVSTLPSGWMTELRTPTHRPSFTRAEEEGKEQEEEDKTMLTTAAPTDAGAFARAVLVRNISVLAQPGQKRSAPL